jgi:hypothetical protein
MKKLEKERSYVVVNYTEREMDAEAEASRWGLEKERGRTDWRTEVEDS